MHLPDLPPPAHAIVFPTWLSAGLGGRIDDDAGITTKTSEATDRHGRYTLGIVDNDPLVAEAPRSSFERFHAPLEVIWALTDPEDALVHCLHAKGRPDVLLTDIDMPRLSGLGLFHELQTRKLPITTAIAHTMHVSESSMKTFAKRAYEKLDAHSRTEAIAICVGNGWI